MPHKVFRAKSFSLALFLIARGHVPMKCQDDAFVFDAAWTGLGKDLQDYARAKLALEMLQDAQAVESSA